MSILSTFLNLALWIPTGEAWNALSQGYTRMLRRLFCQRYKGDKIFGIPAPFVHIATGRWKLELQATKSRLGVLASLVRSGPVELWAVLQEERTWLSVVAQDLGLLKAKYADLPELHAGDWPRWRHYMVDHLAQYKLRVKKTLQDIYDKTCQKDAILVGMWSFYRQLCDRLPRARPPETVWSCRGCARTFRSRGGLGAHFLKSHRKCVQGSVCMACGRQFWTSIRLGHHLRDSSRCVQILLRRGQTTEKALPGSGSKDHSKRAIEEFNMAPSRQVLDPADVEPGAVIWNEAQKSASREISEVFLERREWTMEG